MSGATPSNLYSAFFDNYSMPLDSVGNSLISTSPIFQYFESPSNPNFGLPTDPNIINTGNVKLYYVHDDSLNDKYGKDSDGFQHGLFIMRVSFFSHNTNPYNADPLESDFDNHFVEYNGDYPNQELYKITTNPPVYKYKIDTNKIVQDVLMANSPNNVFSGCVSITPFLIDIPFNFIDPIKSYYQRDNSVEKENGLPYLDNSYSSLGTDLSYFSTIQRNVNIQYVYRYQEGQPLQTYIGYADLIINIKYDSNSKLFTVNFALNFLEDSNTLQATTYQCILDCSSPANLYQRYNVLNVNNTGDTYPDWVSVWEHQFTTNVLLNNLDNEENASKIIANYNNLLNYYTNLSNFHQYDEFYVNGTNIVSIIGYLNEQAPIINSQNTDISYLLSLNNTMQDYYNYIPSFVSQINSNINNINASNNSQIINSIIIIQQKINDIKNNVLKNAPVVYSWNDSTVSSLNIDLRHPAASGNYINLTSSQLSSSSNLMQIYNYLLSYYNDMNSLCIAAVNYNPQVFYDQYNPAPDPKPCPITSPPPFPNITNYDLAPNVNFEFTSPQTYEDLNNYQNKFGDIPGKNGAGLTPSQITGISLGSTALGYITIGPLISTIRSQFFLNSTSLILNPYGRSVGLFKLRQFFKGYVRRMCRLVATIIIKVFINTTKFLKYIYRLVSKTPPTTAMVEVGKPPRINAFERTRLGRFDPNRPFLPSPANSDAATVSKAQDIEIPGNSSDLGTLGGAVGEIEEELTEAGTITVAEVGEEVAEEGTIIALVAIEDLL